MKFFNYTIHILFKGDGNAGRRINSILRIKLGVEGEDDYEPSVVIDNNSISFYGDRFNIDHAKCGKDWEKYFNIKQEPADGYTKIIIQNTSKYPTVFTREGWVAEVVN